MNRLKDPWAIGSLLISCVIALIAALLAYYVLSERPIVPSADAGDVLAYGNTVFGEGVIPLRYPPLVPAMVHVGSWYFGPIESLRVVAAVGIFALTMSAFALAYVLGGPVAGVLAALLASFAPATAEMVGWYGVPNLMGIAFVMLAWACLVRDIEKPSWLSLSGLALASALTVAAHHLAAFFLATSLGIICVSALVTKAWSWRRGLLTAAGIAVLSLPSFPAYIGYVTHAATAGRGSSIDFATIYDGVASVHRVMGATMVGGVLFGLVWSLWRLGTGTRDAATHLMLGGSAGFIAVYLLLLNAQNIPARMPYFMLPPTVVLLGVGLGKRKGASRPLSARVTPTAAFVAVLLLFPALNYGPHLNAATSFYSFQDQADLEALRFVRENTSRDAVILPLTTGFESGQAGGYHYSWWIQGLGERRAMLSGNAYYLTFDDQIQETEEAAIVAAHGYTIDTGAYWLTVNLNRSDNNHIIHAKFGNVHSISLFQSDASDNVTFGDGSSRRISDAPVRYGILSNESRGTTIEEHYHWPDTELVRTVSVTPDQPLRIQVFVRSLNPVTGVNIWLWSGFGTRTLSVVSENTSASIEQGVAGETLITDIDGAGGGSQVVGYRADPQYGLPAIRLSWNGNETAMSTGWTIRQRGLSPETPRGMTPCEVLARRDVDFLYLLRGSPLAERIPGIDAFSNSKVILRRPTCEPVWAFLRTPVALEGFALSPREAHMVQSLENRTEPFALIEDPLVATPRFAGELASALYSRGIPAITASPPPPLGPKEPGDAISLLAAAAPAVWGRESAIADGSDRLSDNVILFHRRGERLGPVAQIEDYRTVFAAKEDDVDWVLQLSNAPLKSPPAALEQQGNLSISRSFEWDEVKVMRTLTVENDGVLSVSYRMQAQRPMTNAEIDIVPPFGEPFVGLSDSPVSWGLGNTPNLIELEATASAGLANVTVVPKAPGYGFDIVRLKWTGYAAEWILTLRLVPSAPSVEAPRILTPCDLRATLGGVDILIPTDSHIRSRLPLNEQTSAGDWTVWNPDCTPVASYEAVFGSA